MKALNALSEQITTSQSSINSQFSTLNSTMSSGLKEVVHAIKTQSQPNTPSVIPSPVTQTPASVDLSPVLSRLDKIEFKYSNLESTVNSLAQTQANLTSSLDTIAKEQANMTNTISSLAQTLEAFIKASSPTGSSNDNSTGSSPSNGYKIKTIHQLYAFQRGNNTFKELIEKLNDMKIE